MCSSKITPLTQLHNFFRHISSIPQYSNVVRIHIRSTGTRSIQTVSPDRTDESGEPVHDPVQIYNLISLGVHNRDLTQQYTDQSHNNKVHPSLTRVGKSTTYRPHPLR